MASGTKSITLQSVHARELLDSRGFPTLEVELTATTESHPASAPLRAQALVPSGASTGEGEALELRDGDAKRYLGKGVLKAVANVNERIAPALSRRQFPTQSLLDQMLRDLDGTPNKSNLGANAILGVSLAYARIRAQAHEITLTESLARDFGTQSQVLPVPLMNIINGGKHADNSLDIQECMIVPAGFDSFREALRAGAEIFHRLKKILHTQGLSTGVGDEGGFAPVFEGENPHEQALSAILMAIKDAGYRAGEQVFLALDCAASEFSPTPGRYRFEGTPKTSEEMIQIYESWCDRYPILSIEDGLAEHDWSGWSMLTERLGKRIQLVGDDLFCTRAETLREGISKKAANAILIKLNQIGTVTETLETMNLAREGGYASIVSHRSGETEDAFIADLAVATGCGQIKTGSASRTDRIAKYNQLLRIEERLGSAARYRGLSTYATLKR